MHTCKAIGCNATVHNGTDYCSDCIAEMMTPVSQLTASHPESLSIKYPKYYKSVEHLSEVDVYAVHQLFNINDPSGCLHHASKKLLLSGVRTGGKSAHKDIKEARDTLTRWLQLNPEE